MPKYGQANCQRGKSARIYIDFYSAMVGSEEVTTISFELVEVGTPKRSSDSENLSVRDGGSITK